MRLSLYNASIIAGFEKLQRSSSSAGQLVPPPHPPLKRSVLKTPRVILQLKWKKKNHTHTHIHTSVVIYIPPSSCTMHKANLQVG